MTQPLDTPEPVDISAKAPHDLHLSTSAEDLIEKLDRRLESREAWHPSSFIDAPLEALVIGGSIPLGIGSPRSDVDVIALVQNERDLPNAAAIRPDVIFRSSREGESHIIVVSGPIEIDINVISMMRIESIFETARRGKGLPPTSDMRLLARLKHGWVISQGASSRDLINKIQNDRTIEIRSALVAYILAYQSFEDAVAAIDDDPILALHLGRMTVDWLMQAYFAALGHLYIGDKWLRLMHRRNRATLNVDVDVAGEVEDVLFPTLSRSNEGAVAYLNKVASFAVGLRSRMAKDPALGLALRMSRQVDEDCWQRLN